MSKLNESKTRLQNDGCCLFTKEMQLLFGTVIINVFLFQDASCLRGRADWFLCFKPSVMYWLRPTTPTGNGPKIKKKISLTLRQNVARFEWAAQRLSNSSASSIKVKTLFGECLSYWLCISLVTWILCCIGVMHSPSQHEKEWGEKRHQILESMDTWCFSHWFVWIYQCQHVYSYIFFTYCVTPGLTVPFK